MSELIRQIRTITKKSEENVYYIEENPKLVPFIKQVLFLILYTYLT